MTPSSATHCHPAGPDRSPSRRQSVEVAVRIVALPAEQLGRVRAGGSDASGLPPVALTADGGEPLRCCLRSADVGEALLLFGYEPPLPVSPYRALSAVFAHAAPCPGHRGGYPAGWTDRPQVFRAYDDHGWIHPATRVFDGGGDPGAVLAAMLAEPGVAQVLSHNVAYGCFMFRVISVDEPVRISV